MTNYSHNTYISVKRQWAALFRSCLCLAVASLAAASCDTGVVDFGTLESVQEIIDSKDQIQTTTAQFEAVSWSDTLGHVSQNARNCYFGQVIDPVTGVGIRADYACQLHCFEGELFPHDSMIVNKTAAGLVQCDSCELIVYYNSWYGDKNAPLKAGILPLDKANIMDSYEVFESNVDLMKYVEKPAKVVASKTFTAWDNTLTNAALTATTHAHGTRISLPLETGHSIMQQYYANPRSFKDTYTFLRTICPGYYVRYDGGDDAMVKVSATSLNVYYRLKTKYNGNDTIYNACTNFVGTGEVVQATHFESVNLDKLLSQKNCTYVSSPAGVYTEVVLPIDDIVKGHEADSLARVQLTMNRYNANPTGQYDNNLVFGAPKGLAMIMKKELTSFFAKGYKLEAEKFAYAELSSQYNTYDFTNIALLVSYMHRMKKEGDTEWNHVVLVPVTVQMDNTYGNVIAVNHDMDVTAARLVGGDTKLKINVTYSRYK